jgi:hypothetical protein
MKRLVEGQTLNSKIAYSNGPMRRRNTKATTLIHDGLSSKLRYIVNKYGDASFFVSDIWSMATQPIPTGFRN